MPLDINASEVLATDRNSGLRDVAALNAAEIATILAHRPYTSIPDFWARASLDQDITERLIQCGAFDSLYRPHGQCTVARRDLLLIVFGLARLRTDDHAPQRQETAVNGPTHSEPSVHVLAHECVVATCAGCARDFGDGDDGPGTVHFDTTHDALDTLRDANWTVLGDRALCPLCTARELCASQGHTWGAWHFCHCGGTIADHASGCRRYRTCTLCLADQEGNRIPLLSPPSSW